MIASAYIIPTGDEIRDGTVLDLDCPKILAELVRLNPGITVTRVPPVVDVEANIVSAMERCLEKGAELIVLVGGSGGGHRYSDTLGKDFTHSAMEDWLDRRTSHEIYGKNGHLWSKLVCGTKGKCLVVNVPGPIREASAAIEAFVRSVREGGGIRRINDAMSQAVFEQYPQDKVENDVQL